MGNITEILHRKAMLSFDHHEIEKYPDLWKIETKAKATVDFSNYMLFNLCKFNKIILDGKLILNHEVELDTGQILTLSNAYIEKKTNRYELNIAGIGKHTVYFGITGTGKCVVHHSKIDKLRTPITVPNNITLAGPNGLSGYYHTTDLDIMCKSVPNTDFATFKAFDVIRVPLGYVDIYRTAGYPKGSYSEGANELTDYAFSLDYSEDYIEDFSEQYLDYIEQHSNNE